MSAVSDPVKRAFAIRNHVLSLIQADGAAQEIKGPTGCMTVERVGSFTFALRSPLNPWLVETPANAAYSLALAAQRSKPVAAWSLCVWYGGKVLSLQWDDPGAFAVVSFTRGPWEDAVLALLSEQPAAAGTSEHHERADGRRYGKEAVIHSALCEHLQLLLLHLEAESVPVQYAWIVRHFAAGDDIPVEDLHMALWGIETAAYFAPDEPLAKVAREEASYCLAMCSAGYRERVQHVFTKLVHEMDAAAAKSGM